MPPSWAKELLVRRAPGVQELPLTSALQAGAEGGFERRTQHSAGLVLRAGEAQSERGVSYFGDPGMPGRPPGIQGGLDPEPGAE